MAVNTAQGVTVPWVAGQGGGGCLSPSLHRTLPASPLPWEHLLDTQRQQDLYKSESAEWKGTKPPSPLFRVTLLSFPGVRQEPIPPVKLVFCSVSFFFNNTSLVEYKTYHCKHFCACNVSTCHMDTTGHCQVSSRSLSILRLKVGEPGGH